MCHLRALHERLWSDVVRSQSAPNVHMGRRSPSIFMTNFETHPAHSFSHSLKLIILPSTGVSFCRYDNSIVWASAYYLFPKPEAVTFESRIYTQCHIQKKIRLCQSARRGQIIFFSLARMHIAEIKIKSVAAQRAPDACASFPFDRKFPPARLIRAGW